MTLPFTLDPLRGRPEATAAEAAGTAREVFGIEGEASLLPGERDRNFLLRTGAGERFVLKLSGASETPARLDLQKRVLRAARRKDPALRLPETVPARSERAGVRLFRYLEGVPLSSVRRRPRALLEAVGGLLGRLQRALAGFSHPGLEEQEIPWAPRHAAAVIEAAAPVVRDGALYRRIADQVLPRLPELLALPVAAIHNDANDDNLLLVEGEPEAATPARLALLDFGDALRAPVVVEAATAALYVACASREPLRAAASVLAGFARERPVSEEESDLFRAAVASRALVSAGVAALRRARVAGTTADPYLLVSESAVRGFLAALAAEPAPITTGRFRRAAGHEPLPDLVRKRSAVARAAREAATPLGGEGRWLDLSPTNPALDPLDPSGSRRRVATDGSRGRYGEARLPETPAPLGGEPCTISLGIEVFAAEGTPVIAPLDGEALPGKTLALRHEAEGVAFRTVYRGISREAGGSVRRGDLLGRIAGGAGPARLHFQVALTKVAPRLAEPRDQEILLALCPDPSPFFGERSQPHAPEEPSRQLAARRRHLSGALSVAYDDPVGVVRGRGARLYDDFGRDYLDLVNNVCHVGHAHPRVAGAIARQARLLNTNTRYLYRQLPDYAERLAATLPDPLEVVFLTNSGSEANDLALRIARAHLGRRETLVFEGGYHGNLTSLIEVSPYKLDGPGGGPGPRWLHRLPTPDGYRGRFRREDPAFPDALIADARQRVRAAGPATLFVEAILSCGGQIVPPPGYLRALYRAVREAGGVIVADEVQTGFFRVGPAGWAFAAVQAEDREAAPEGPDIVTLGKPAGNGHPLAAVATTRALAESFDNGMEYFNTFGGNPVSCAAGLAVLEVIEEEGLAERAEAVGKQLLTGLAELAARYPILGDVRGRGLFLGVELVQDPETRTPATAEARRVVNRLRELRILNAADGPDANVLKLKPPLAFSAEDADHYLEALELVLKEQS